VSPSSAASGVRWAAMNSGPLKSRNRRTALAASTDRRGAGASISAARKAATAAMYSARPAPARQHEPNEDRTLGRTASAFRNPCKRGEAGTDPRLWV
jgi:hypothetical protein